MSETIYDYIIIGSGTSGGMAGKVLQSGGAKCLMLEAGKRFKREDFPMKEAVYTPQMFWSGGADLTVAADLLILRGKCVGGGSIVNQALMDRFDDIAIDDWRDETGIDYFNRATMDEHYDAVETDIVMQTIPPEWRNRNQELFIQGMDANGFRWHPLRRAQSDCGTPDGNDCICCLGGCHRGSKQSSMETTIPKAEAAGMELRSEVLVTQIESNADGVTVHAKAGGKAETFRAAHVILAAGALGTTELLLKSGFKQHYPALGTRLAMHPQFMNYAVFEEPVNANRGALQGVASEDPNMRKEGYKLENVFAPPMAVSLVTNKTGSELQEFMKWYSHLGCIEVAIRDESAGEMFLTNSGRLQVKKPLTAQDQERKRKGFEAIDKIFDILKPREIVHGPMGFGLHSMGGCCIGQDGKSSVFNPEFALHDHPNVHCADISTFPNAPGINPALTIYAMTHRMATGLLNN